MSNKNDMPAKRNIQGIIFHAFLYVTTALIILVTCLLSIVQYSSLHKTMVNDIQRTGSAIADNIDLQISQMDTICLNVLGSVTVKNTFSKFSQEEDTSSYQYTLEQAELANALTALKGMDSSIRQVNIYSMDGNGYGVGNYNGVITFSEEEESWYAPSVEKNGLRYTSVSVNPLFSQHSGKNSTTMFFSVVRMYFDNYNNPRGFVQVMKYYDSVIEQADSPQTDYNMSISVYDSDHNLIYPQEESQTSRAGKGITYTSEADYSGFTIVTSVQSSDIILPILKNLFWIPILFVFLLILCYYLSRRISRWLAQPLNRIYDFLSQPDSDESFQMLTMDDTGITEIDKLRDSINVSIKARESSMESILTLRESEMQARMLALQAQMNPHFLYNSLNTVRAMSEEGMNQEVSEMCMNITSILRYISSDRESVTTVEEELEQCNLFLECIRLRYKDNFSYEFDVDDALLDLKIPKLCIQLLVENSSKFVTRTAPPWNIRVEGYIDSGLWLITVKDNGPGFDPKVAEDLRAKMDRILETSTLPSLELDGMGILNIFIRMYLIFGKAFRFRFGNLPDRGSYVIVGGRLDENSETL